MRYSKQFFITLLPACTLVILLCTILFIVATQSANTIPTLWKFQSIDTMKYSRDAARDPKTIKKIPVFIKQIADMKANYVAIDTPYDEEFYPVLKAWVDEARKYNLQVWFRGNFSAWEGWFDYPQMTNSNDDHAMVKNFIARHQDLFREGDIFTPVPEPENGAIGDPRGSDEKTKQFNQFLITSYNNCLDSFARINKAVYCGYFSMNGDVALNILTKDTVDKIGGVVVVDHYVDSPEKMGQEVDALHEKFGAKVVLGEFGAPIPDINGDMTEKEQAFFVDQLLRQLYIRRSVVEGVNYWVIAGGSTSLLNDDFSPRLVTQVIKQYYQPNFWEGKITDTAGDTIFNARVLANTKDQVSFANNGDYSLVTPSTSLILSVQEEGYIAKTLPISFDKTTEIFQSIVLEPVHASIWYRCKLLLRRLFFHFNFTPFQ